MTQSIHAPQAQFMPAAIHIVPLKRHDKPEFGHKIWGAGWHPSFSLAAAAVVVAAVRYGVVAAAAEQDEQDDDPAQITAAEIIVTHNEYLRNFLSS